MKKLILPLMLTLATNGIAQQKSIGLDVNTSVIHISANAAAPVPCSGIANTQSVDLNWKPILIRKPVEIEHEGPDHEMIVRIKAEKMKLKMEYERTHSKSGEKTTAVTPVVGTNFAGNTYDGNWPLDNTIAISNGGK